MLNMGAMGEATSSASEHADWDWHWSAYAESNVLNPAQAYRKELILFERLGLGHATGTPRVLDVGSGQGELSREITRRHPKVEMAGLELSATGLEEASRTVPGARFFQQDIMRPLAWPELAGWATHAVCSEVLEHVIDPVQALANVRPALVPGGRLVVTVPSGPMSAFDCHIGHLRHFTARSLETTLRDAGYSTVEVRPCRVPVLQPLSADGGGPWPKAHRGCRGWAARAAGGRSLGDGGLRYPVSIQQHSRELGLAARCRGEPQRRVEPLSGSPSHHPVGRR